MRRIFLEGAIRVVSILVIQILVESSCREGLRLWIEHELSIIHNNSQVHVTPFQNMI